MLEEKKKPFHFFKMREHKNTFLEWKSRKSIHTFHKLFSLLCCLKKDIHEKITLNCRRLQIFKEAPDALKLFFTNNFF